MRGFRLTHLLIGTALAAVLAAPGSQAWAESEADAAISALVPMPDLADAPPPTIKDLGAAPGANVEAPVPTMAETPPPSPVAPVQAAAPIAPPAPVVAAPARPVEAAPAATTASVPATPPAAPVLTTGLDPADQAIAGKLGEIIAGRQFERIIPNKKERGAIEAFYQGRSFAPLWTEKGAASTRANQARATFAKAEMIGLDPKDYRAPDIAAGVTPDAAAEAELKFTSVALTYARHVQSGRTDPSRISANIEYKLPMPEPTDVLAKITASNDLEKTFASFEPPHEGYQLLRKKLAELRGTKDEATSVQIPNGNALKVATGKKPTEDARVPALRQRLGLTGDDKVYDATLADAVKKFQASKKLAETGILNQATIDAMNGVRKDRQVDAVVATMERWRWLPRDLGKAYVMLNIPDFTLKVVKDEAVIWRTRVVVGKPNTATPIFSSAIENILVNPTWHVPDSIIYGEYLPAMQQDPGVLSRMGFKVSQNRDGSTSISQPPGPGNALGRIKFNFQNRFQVYLHDTPDKHLFAHDRRSYSHGCMRVQNPDQFGAVLASIALPGQGYTAEKLTSMFGKGETWLNFKDKIPVHLTYQTAYVDDAGSLVVREDIYSHDGRVLAALKGNDRDYGQEEVMAQVKRTPVPKRVAAQQEPSSPIESFFRIFR